MGAMALMGSSELDVPPSVPQPCAADEPAPVHDDEPAPLDDDGPAPLGLSCGPGL